MTRRERKLRIENHPDTALVECREGVGQWSRFIQTPDAIQAAFQIGRVEYLREKRSAELQPCVDRALAAMEEMQKHSTPSQVVIGGGRSRAGKIRWLLENEGARTIPQLAERLRESEKIVGSTVSYLFQKGLLTRLGEAHNYTYFLLKQEVVA